MTLITNRNLINNFANKLHFNIMYIHGQTMIEHYFLTFSSSDDTTSSSLIAEKSAEKPACEVIG